MLTTIPLNMLKIICDGVWEVIWSWERGLHEWDSSLYKTEPRELPCLIFSSNIWRHNEKKPVYEPGSGSSSDTETVSAMILDFLLGPGLMSTSCANRRVIWEYLVNKYGKINFSCPLGQEFYLTTNTSSIFCTIQWILLM